MNAILRKHRRLIAELIYSLMAAASLALSFLLRFEFSLPPLYLHMLAVSVPLLVAVKLAVFRGFALRDLAWRYLGFSDLLRMASGSLAASAASAVLLRLAIGSAFPRSILVIDLLALTALMATGHAGAKLYAEAQQKQRSRRLWRVAIYGAGSAGASLAREIQANPDIGLAPTVFLDDNPLNRNLRIHGIPVVGGLSELGEAVRKRRIETVLVAIPSIDGARLTAILARCQAAGIAAKLVPLADFTGTWSPIPEIREVRLEDLLGRRQIDLGGARFCRRLNGVTALVTGAGGSIGSELCRQIARCEPAALVGFDQSETALYEIDRELCRTHPGLKFYPEVGNIRDQRRLEEVFRGYAPQSVYHAAAYKHVPLMEAHLLEAIANNVFGTRNVAVAAAESGARDFVLISSDKAVRPANVMGATKRLAELVIQSMASSRTRFVAVRFGNVLGSSGSVVPAFREQIARGGPVTVTHPEMRRFFMTAPEAAQLVLEAGAMGKPGEILVLNMGEPVGILDLAHKMILLSGLRPGHDIPIEIIGIRPGEKLSEELSAYEENTLSTHHAQIRVLAGAPVAANTLDHGLDDLGLALEEGDIGSALETLRDLVNGYEPSGSLRRRLEERTDKAYA